MPEQKDNNGSINVKLEVTVQLQLHESHDVREYAERCRTEVENILKETGRSAYKVKLAGVHTVPKT